MKKELVICKYNDKKLIALLEDEELVERYEEDENDKSIEGNIYVGKVQNILTGLQSAFVNIGEKKNAFIHVKDIMPKIDITKEEPLEEVPIKTMDVEKHINDRLKRAREVANSVKNSDKKERSEA